MSEEPKRWWMSWTSTVCVSSGVASACAPCGGVPSSVVVMGWSSAELSRSVADGRIGIVAVEELDEHHSDDADEHEVQEHRLGGVAAHPDGTAARGVAEVARDHHDAQDEQSGPDHGDGEVPDVLKQVEEVFEHTRRDGLEQLHVEQPPGPEVHQQPEHEEHQKQQTGCEDPGDRSEEAMGGKEGVH